MILWETLDKSGRLIHLSIERWKHIAREHPEVADMEKLKEVIMKPDKITLSFYDPAKVRYYYKFFKKLNRYLMIAVKYLNGNGFIITAYLMREIR